MGDLYNNIVAAGGLCIFVSSIHSAFSRSVGRCNCVCGGEESAARPYVGRSMPTTIFDRAAVNESLASRLPAGIWTLASYVHVWAMCSERRRQQMPFVRRGLI